MEKRKIHELKIYPEYAHLRRIGKKKFEIRKNDRDFKVGDILLLREYAPGFGYLPKGGDEISGDEPFEVALVEWMTDFGLAPGFVCMSTRKLMFDMPLSAVAILGKLREEGFL